MIRHRRRRLELLHAFVLASSAVLLAAIALGVLAGLANVGSDARARLAAGEVAALFGWIALAVVGHAHKIVPFIAWNALRGRGVTTHADGRPVLFADLFDARAARVTLVGACAAVALVLTGILAASSTAVFVAGCAFALVGVVAIGNLGFGPRRLARSVRRGRAPARAPAPGTVGAHSLEERT